MIAVVLATGAGLVAGSALWRAMRPRWSGVALLRANWRGRPLPTAAGVVVALAVVTVELGRALVAAAGTGWPVTTRERSLVAATVVGLALLGWVDDVAGTPEFRGFRGHLRALAAGRPTTGLLKLAGGAVLALAVTAPLDSGRPGRWLADAGLIALSANLANLFDRAPGRALKLGAAAFVALLAASPHRRELDGLAVAMGASMALLPDDLHERLMIGDAGANAVGGAVALGLVLVTGATVRDVALAVVAALNLVGEVVSFSRVIDAVPPLRALDRAGRLP